MALYGRSDVMSVAVPLNSGGCGATHSRPVADGVATEEWDLERACARCARVLRKDPLWSASVAEIPETPDERAAREDAEKRGERALKKAQEETNVKLTGLTAQIVELLQKQGQGAVPGEDVIAALVAREVAKAMQNGTISLALAQEPEPEPEPYAVPSGASLERMHVRTLGKMCRERGLNDKGGKTDLIARLTAAPATGIAAA